MSDYWSYYDDSLPEPPPAKVWVNNQEYRRVDDAASPAVDAFNGYIRERVLQRSDWGAFVCGWIERGKHDE